MPLVWRCDCTQLTFVHREHCDRCGTARHETAHEKTRLLHQAQAAAVATKRRVLDDLPTSVGGYTVALPKSLIENLASLASFSQADLDKMLAGALKPYLYRSPLKRSSKT